MLVSDLDDSMLYHTRSNTILNSAPEPYGSLLDMYLSQNLYSSRIWCDCMVCIFPQVHTFSPNASLIWRECASIPVERVLAKTTVINGMVYVGGGAAKDSSQHNLVCKYDPVKDEWTTLPPAPVKGFGVGQLNGKLVIVGGWKEHETADVHVFEDDIQQWVKSIPPMPRGIAASTVVSHSSSLVVCGTPGKTSPASVLVYNSQSSQWHLAAALPLTFNSMISSSVVVNDTYYIAVGVEGVINQEKFPSSPAVFSLPLSTLLDPNAPQDPSIWQCMPDTPCHGSHLAATGGCLLALGGLRSACNDLKDDEVVVPNLSTAVHAYCPATSSWVKIGDLRDLRFCPTITTMSSGELFIAGGGIPNDERDNPIIINDKVFMGIIS